MQKKINQVQSLITSCQQQLAVKSHMSPQQRTLVAEIHLKSNKYQPETIELDMGIEEIRELIKGF